ncbi:MAG: hypothetical protein GC164_10135 [Phycisphaera sp.]|nr:hypothetical protein [Phycisphaera sp.]
MAHNVIKHIVIILAGLTLGLARPAHAQVLVDYDDGQDNGVHDKELLAGGFTGLNKYAYAPWYLLSKTGGVEIKPTLPCEIGSPENLVEATSRIMGLDTGHTIAQGETYNLAFHWRDASGWRDESTIELVLYYTDNDKIDGQTVGAVVLNSGKRKATETWEAVAGKGAAFENDTGVGKTLFLRIQCHANEKEYARVDNVYVQAVPPGER